MASAVADDRELQLKIDEYGNMLYKISYLRLQNVQDAEDVVQEVFYQYLKHTQAFESPEHEKAWLIKVTLNTCRKLWRSAKRHPREELDHALGQVMEMPMTSETAAQTSLSEPEEAAVRQEERRRILNAVMALPARYRDVIHLFYYEEISVKEIARITGRGESTVTSQLTRGRGLLKKMLKEEYDFG